jgi:hypothetical protein
MPVVTVEDVKHLIADMESNYIERTVSVREDKLGPAVCALSNDFPNHKRLGYIIMQYSAKENYPVRAYLKWANRIPSVFASAVLSTASSIFPTSVEKDKNCIAMLRHYRSLAPMSMEAHKPMFLLKPADGAIGAHTSAVKKCYDEYEALTENILKIC